MATWQLPYSASEIGRQGRQEKCKRKIVKIQKCAKGLNENVVKNVSKKERKN